MKVFKRYLLFYLAVGSLYGIFSFIFDLLFCQIDYGVKCHYDYPLSFIFYALTLLFYYFPISLPISMFYNSFVNFKISNYKLRRYGFGLLFGLCVGYIAHRNGWSFYIGQFRHLKNIIVFGLTGLSIEILRTIIVKRRYRDIIETQ